MASEYFGLNRGQTQFQVTFGTSSGSTDIEIRVDLTKFGGGVTTGSKEEALRVIDEIRNFIMTDAAKAGGAGIFG